MSPLPTGPTPRELLTPLREHEPRREQVDALLRALDARERPAAVAPRRRPRIRRRAGLASAAAAALLVVVALLPAADRPGTGATPGAAAVLRASAASAAGAEAPAGPWRYTKVRRLIVYSAVASGQVAEDRHLQEVERWVGAAWRGRELARAGTRRTTGPEAVRALLPVLHYDGLEAPVDRPYSYGEGPLASLDPAELPAGRDAIARVLREGIANGRWNAPPARPGTHFDPAASLDAYTTYQMALLLAEARLEPGQRAALLDVLATAPEARDLGTVTDAVGRSGRGIELRYGGHQLFAAAGVRLVVDPGTSRLLQWTLIPVGGAHHPGAPETTETLLADGYADRPGEVPSRVWR